MVAVKAKTKSSAPPDPLESGGMAQHIGRVAARLFATRGYDATPVRAIVEAAGITKPTLYYHFGSKEGLAQALLTVPLTQLQDVLRGLMQGSEDPVATAVGVLEAHFAYTREDPDRARFVFALHFGPMGSSLAPELARLTEGLANCWVRLGQALAEARVIAPERAAECAANLKGMMLIHTLDYLYRGGTLEPDLARRLVGDMLHGFLREGGTRE